MKAWQRLNTNQQNLIMLIGSLQALAGALETRSAKALVARALISLHKANRQLGQARDAEQRGGGK
jgi:hypothetical protein